MSALRQSIEGVIKLHQENPQTGKSKKRGILVQVNVHMVYIIIKIHHNYVFNSESKIQVTFLRSADEETVIKVSFGLNHVL